MYRGDVSGAGEDEGERSERLGHHAERYLVAGLPDRRLRHVRAAVVVRGADVLHGHRHTDTHTHRHTVSATTLAPYHTSSRSTDVRPKRLVTLLNV